MNTRLIATITAAAGALLLAGCSSTTGSSSADAPAKTAEQVVTTLSAKIPTVKATKTFTAEDDPNHQLGRPGGYTSKSAFADSRIPADQVAALDPAASERGGSVEVFADAAGAKARADYIQAVAKGLPLAAEYDYQSGPVLVRVSRFLTPAQAGEYEAALKG